MAEFPAMPLFTDAYLGDTTHLTTIEHGAYLLLLITSWRARGNTLPDNDRMLARYAKCTMGQWARIRPILEPFFSISSDGWVQGRLMDEAAHVRQVRESQRANGVSSALKRKGRHSAKRDASSNGAMQFDEDTDNQPATPSPSPQSIGSEPNGSGAIAPDKPDEIDPAKIIFGAGLKVMTDGGMTEMRARSILGKWRREHGDAHVIAALGTCKREGAINPVEFIEGVFRNGRKSASGHGPTIEGALDWINGA